MKKIIYLILLIPLLVNAQLKPEEPKFGIKFGGFIKTDNIYDSRQTVNIREGHFLLYPDNKVADGNNSDINDKQNFNMLAIQTRLKGSVFGPDAFGAKTSGLIESDFFGNENASFSDVNGLRLRHAIIKLNWSKTELLTGQFWHPMFCQDAFPSVISFNTGAPFQPFSRNPQIRFTHKIGGLSLIGTAFTQRDFQGTGPDGSSSKYLRNAAIPNTNFQLQFRPDSSEHLVGLGVDYKIITPRLYSEMPVVGSTTKTKYKVNESLSSFSAFGYLKLAFKPVNFKLYGVYAQNATDLTMIGGYGVRKVVNMENGRQDYTNLTTASVWSEVITNGKKLQYALFYGYTQNMGSADSIAGSIYARGANIDHVYRIAPRVIFISGKMNIALECEYTVASYGTANKEKNGLSKDNRDIGNIRGLLSFIYNF